MKKVKVLLDKELQKEMEILISTFCPVFGDRRSMKINVLMERVKLSRYSNLEKNNAMKQIIYLIKNPTLF